MPPDGWLPAHARGVQFQVMRLLVPALLLACVGLARAAGPVEVEVKGVRVEPAWGSPVVLRDEKAGGGRSLPIWIGPLEAEAILLELEGVVAPRPLTHDLMKRIVEALGARLDRVVVTELVEQTYRARLDLEPPRGERRTLDARPRHPLPLAPRF